MRGASDGAWRDAFTGADPRVDRVDVDRRARDARGVDAESNRRTGSDPAAAGVRAACPHRVAVLYARARDDAH